MDYIISDKAKKVTLGLAIVGLVLLIIGFSQQKDFVYAKKVDNHTVEIIYNGHADIESQDNLKETIISKMSGYELDFHDASHEITRNMGKVLTLIMVQPLIGIFI